jgi:hypothetical protein
MTATETAVTRGREAAKGPRYEPVTVEHRGWLVARVKDTRSGKTEGVYEQGANLYFYGVGRTAGGEITVHNVRDGKLKRIVRAMLHGPHRDDLINETTEARQAKSHTPARRIRRKR